MKNLTDISRKDSLTDIADDECFKRMLTGLENLLCLEIPGSRAFEKLSRWAGRVRRQLQNAEVHNLRYIIKWAMLARPRWRQRVLSDLGGDAALQNWCERQSRADAAAEIPARDRPVNLNPTARPTATPKASRTESRIKTDSFGLFRLAPITRARRDDSVLSIPTDRYSLPSAVPVFNSHLPGDNIELTELCKQKPIPLKPEELRGQSCSVDLGVSPGSDPAFEHKLTKWGNPVPKKQNAPLRLPAPKPIQAWSFAMADLPEEAFPKRDPP